jgi:DNA-binding NtrC family response regulator
MPRTLSELAARWSDISAELSAAPRVLVVDDEPSITEMLATVLEYAGYECETCGTGEDALAYLSQARFHMLVVDKNLPDLTGLDVIERARRIDPDCEAVVITGYPSLQSILQAIDLRGVDYLTKPLDSIDVMTAVLGRARLRRNRRVLARRMLADLRDAVSERTDGALVDELSAARDRVERFRVSLEGKRRVLVWQDEEESVRSALDPLQTAGFLVWTAGSGGEVISTCSRRHVSVLIVSDSYGDMTGQQVVAKTSEHEGHPELIYVSARDRADDALAAVNAGAAGYAVKPLSDPRPLVHAVRRACDIQHERMLHFKMIAELYAILGRLEQEPGGEATRQKFETTLSEFDVKSARHALQDVEEDAD